MTPLAESDLQAGTDLQPGTTRWRSLLIIIAMVILSDITLYHTDGYAGTALFFPAAAILLAVGRGRKSVNAFSVLAFCLLLILAARLAWSGSALRIVVSAWLLNAFAMAIHGACPYLLESVMFLASTIPGGYAFLHSIQVRWRRIVLDPVDRGKSSRLLSIGLPIISVVFFGAIFLMANPDLIKELSAMLGDTFERLRTWLLRYSFSEILFWCAVSWITAGLLFPIAQRAFASSSPEDTGSDGPTADNSLYSPFRNTLLALIGLFSIYVVFEFQTLWFRQFPKGFHYSGYAHEGAAWLTAALALATVILSLMFRGTMMRHSRLDRLKRLAWIWSGLNLLLAAAVYNRLFIYIDYNGMTRMRTVGLLGTSCVVAGFLLVLWKIIHRHTFPWLIRHQLLIPTFAVCIYAAAPVDSLAHRFNAARILAGHPEPSVQISEHPMEISAIPVLIPLLDSDDPIIRDGIRALLSVKLRSLRSSQESEATQDWTTRQYGKDHALRALQAEPRLSREQMSDWDLASAQKRFREYAMQWW